MSKFNDEYIEFFFEELINNIKNEYEYDDPSECRHQYIKRRISEIVLDMTSN